MEDYKLASTEVAYENPGEQAPMVFMASGGEIKVSEKTPPWMDQKRSSLPSLTGTENTNRDTADVCMIVAEEAIRKETCRLNTPVECWGCTNPPIYHEENFHTYRNCPNKMDLDVAEKEKQ